MLWDYNYLVKPRILEGSTIMVFLDPLVGVMLKRMSFLKGECYGCIREDLKKRNARTNQRST